MFSSNFTLGILGGGQLGKMLLYDTRKWDIRTRVLEADADAPARLACNEFVQGSLLDEETVYAFGKKCDVLTLEIENVNTDALERLVREGVRVYPPPAALRMIQDKTVQKQFYADNGIATAPFFICESRQKLQEIIDNKTIAYPFVWKSPMFGYDGKGVKIVRQPADLADLPDAPMLIEVCVNIRKELAVIVARSTTGECSTFPVVEMDFAGDANLVTTVGCPANLPPDIAAEAVRLAVQVAEKLAMVGLLAVELFYTTEGQLMVNECAPRPHNSGHLFSDAGYTSQFEQHLRAILGLPLGNTALHTPAAMLNLVGALGHTGAVVYKNMAQVLAINGVTPHIYGKRETRPFRKMGHINVTADTLALAYAKAEQVAALIEVVAK